MSSNGGKKGGKMSLGGKMESVWLKISGHMTLVGEEMLCVLEEHTSVDVCLVRVLVLERLSVAAEWMCSLFQREIESLQHTAAGGGIVDKKKKEKDVKKNPRGKKSTVRPQRAEEGSLAVKSLKAYGKRWTKTQAAATSTEHMETEGFAEDCGLSPDCSEPDAEDSDDDWEESSGDFLDVDTEEVPVEQQERSSSLVHDEHGVTRSHHAGTKSFSCKDCGKRFNRKGDLKKHARIHTGEKPFVCTVCGKGFTRIDHLKRHAKTHTGVKPEMKEADESVLTLLAVQSVHDDDNREGEPLSSSPTEPNSMSYHTEAKSFSCKDCGKMFKRKKHLRNHAVIHTGEKPFACTVCGKGFNRIDILRRHTIIHSVEKPFACTVCGKMFNRKKYLTNHAMIHSGEKPFCCTVCGKGFLWKHHLQRHAVMFHEGEKPYSCAVCDKGFIGAYYLKKHMMSHTGEKPFTCTVCGKGCSQKSALKRHMRTHTGDKTT